MLGHVINGLRIESVLDEDGMGAVFLARQATLNMQRTLKVIRTDHQQEQDLQQRFHREATALRQFQHPNVVSVIDFGRLQNGWLYLAMEYIEGPTLETLVTNNGPMPVERALLILKQIAAALAMAHSRNIAHGALCPSNIILANYELDRLKLCDFGLAGLLNDEKLSCVTDTQPMQGSPSYADPHQVTGSGLGAAPDVYALAGLAYFLLTGRPAFDSVHEHRHQPPTPLSQRCAQPLPPLLEKLLIACLAKDAYDRPTSEELAAHFGRLHAEAAKAVVPVNAEDTLKETPRTEVVGQSPAATTIEGLWVEGANEFVQAIENQIAAVALDLGREVAKRQGLGSALGPMLAEYDRSREALNHLELEYVLLGSQLASTNAGADSAFGVQHQAFGRRIDGLKAGGVHLLRRILEVAVKAAQRLQAPESEALQVELNALLARVEQERSTMLA